MESKRCKWCGKIIKITGDSCEDCCTERWSRCPKNSYEDDEEETGMNTLVTNMPLLELKDIEALQEAGLATVFDIQKSTDEQLLEIRGVGPLVLQRIRASAAIVLADIPEKD